MNTSQIKNLVRGLTISERIIYELEKSGKTHKELIIELEQRGISRSAYNSYIKNGKSNRNPPLDNLEIIADVLGISLTDLTSDTTRLARVKLELTGKLTTAKKLTLKDSAKLREFINKLNTEEEYYENLELDYISEEEENIRQELDKKINLLGHDEIDILYNNFESYMSIQPHAWLCLTYYTLIDGMQDTFNTYWGYIHNISPNNYTRHDYIAKYEFSRNFSPSPNHSLIQISKYKADIKEKIKKLAHYELEELNNRLDSLISMTEDDWKILIHYSSLANLNCSSASTAQEIVIHILTSILAEKDPRLVFGDNIYL